MSTASAESMVAPWLSTPKNELLKSAAVRAGVTLTAFQRIDCKEWQQKESATHDAVLISGVGGEWKVSFGEDDAFLASSFCSGANMRPTLVTTTNIQGCIEARMPAPLARQLLPGVWYQDQGPVQLKDALVPKRASFVDQVAEAEDVMQASVVVADFLNSLVLEREPVLRTEIDWAWSRLASASGNLKVCELARQLGWSHRHFNKKFQDQTGFEAKVASRLMRFSAAYGAILTTSDSLTDVAAKFGYFDQSHMNRDFRSFASVTPGNLRANKNQIY